MPLSGSRVFVLTRDQIIASALRRIGVVAQGESPTYTQYIEGSEALNVMVQAWQSKGAFLWTVVESSLDIVEGEDVYNLPNDDDTLDIMSPVIIAGVDKYKIQMIPLEEFISTKIVKTSGLPNCMTVNYTTNQTIIMLHPVPNGNMTLMYHRVNRLQDFISSTDNPDFPVQWTEALINGLAYRLSFEYGIPLQERQILGVEAENSFRFALSGSRQSGGIQFAPRLR